MARLRKAVPAAKRSKPPADGRALRCQGPTLNCPPYRWADPFKRRAHGVPLVLPLVAFYARSDEHERRRRDFYTLIAREFEFENWDRVQKVPKPEGVAGRDGRRQDTQKPSTRQTAFIDKRAGAAEYLNCGRILDDPYPIDATDHQRDRARVMGDIRRSVALRVVDNFETLTSSLRSVDFGGSGVRSGTAPTIGDARLYAAEDDRFLRQHVPIDLLVYLRQVLIEDRFLWEEPMTPEGRRDALEYLRMALDFAGYALGHHGPDRAEVWQRVMLPRWQAARDIEAKRAMDAAWTPEKERERQKARERERQMRYGRTIV